MATSQSGLGRQNAYLAVAASATATSLVAATANRKIRVHTVVINQGDTTASTVTFNSATVAIFPALKAAANGTIVLPEARSGYFETVTGEALTVTTGAGSTTSIAVIYSLVG